MTLGRVDEVRISILAPGPTSLVQVSCCCPVPGLFCCSVWWADDHQRQLHCGLPCNCREHRAGIPALCRPQCELLSPCTAGLYMAFEQHSDCAPTALYFSIILLGYSTGKVLANVAQEYLPFEGLSVSSAFCKEQLLCPWNSTSCSNWTVLRRSPLKHRLMCPSFGGFSMKFSSFSMFAMWKLARARSIQA